MSKWSEEFIRTHKTVGRVKKLNDEVKRMIKKEVKGNGRKN
jgi:hypothetical protein